MSGAVVRRLEVGHQDSGDVPEPQPGGALGRHGIKDGESVASGLYFYTLIGRRVYRDAEDVDTEVVIGGDIKCVGFHSQGGGYQVKREFHK